MPCEAPPQPPSSDLFNCRMCGDCCRGYGGTVVSAADTAAIASYIGIDEDRFIARYCHKAPSGLLLSQKPDGFCIFFDRLCTIHPVKPNMCRAWPFLPSVLVDAANWWAMASVCPGIRRDVDETVVIEAVRRELDRNDWFGLATGQLNGTSERSARYCHRSASTTI